LQQLHGEHVRRSLRHRDDVGTQRPGRQAGHHAKRVEHIVHVWRRLQVGGNQRAAPLKLAQQEVETRGLVPVGVPAEPNRAGDGRERLGVPCGILTNVKTRKRESERSDTSQ
jgi:hypothetical protein